MAPVDKFNVSSCDVSNWMFLARFLCYIMLFCFFLSVLANLSMESEHKSGACGCKRNKMRCVNLEGMDNISYSDLNAGVPIVHFETYDLTAPTNADSLLTGMAHIYDDKIVINAFVPIIDGAVFHPLKGAVSYNAYVEGPEGKQFIGQLSKDGDKVYKISGKISKAESKKLIVTVTKKENDKEDVILIGGRV